MEDYFEDISLEDLIDMEDLYDYDDSSLTKPTGDPIGNGTYSSIPQYILCDE